jgi:hypothetical protein
MLTDDPTARKCLLLLHFLRGQCSTPGFLFRSLALTVEFLYALIASVCKTLSLFLYGYFAPLEQCEIVLAALVRDDELGFLGVALFLPAAVWPLFFCGRSIGFSPTSTWLLMRKFSVRCIVRHTTDSATSHESPVWK